MLAALASPAQGASAPPAAPGGATSAPQLPPTSPPTPAPLVVAVVGDSISSTAPDARYRTAAQTSARPEVWWSRVVNGAGLRPTRVVELAVGGTGYVRRGGLRTASGTVPCRGTVFADRLSLLEQARPDVVIVAGGRNDGYRCSTSAQRTKASVREQRAAIATFYDRLAQVVRRRGIATDHVLVTAPWGSAAQDGRATISAIVEAAARSRGFVYVPLSPLQGGDLLDTTHPNASGTRALATEFTRNSGIERLLGGTPTQPPRATRSVAGPCSASEQGDARRQTWGRTGMEGLVAARLTRQRRAPLPPSTSAGWYATARAAGAQVVARPRAGDVAWWPSQPWLPGARREHVGSVLATTSGGSVVVEVGAEGRCGRTTYRDAAVPRAYLRLPGVSGSARGAVKVAPAGSRSVRVTGWAVDPDAPPGARTRLRVTATVAGRAVGRAVEGVAYDVDVVVRLGRTARGKRVKVVVEALNAPRTHGRAATRLTTRTLRLAR